MSQRVGDLVGRRISGVVVKRAWRRNPTSQVFLIFDDGHYYEFYCLDSVIFGTGGVNPGGPEAVRRYIACPDCWPVTVELADQAGAERLLHDLALGKVVGCLRGHERHQSGLASTLARLGKEGWNWKLLYEEALRYRLPDAPAPPTVEELSASPELAAVAATYNRPS